MSTAGARRSRARPSSWRTILIWRTTLRTSNFVWLTMLSTRQRFATSLWRCTWSTRSRSLTYQSTTRLIWPSTSATGSSNASSPAPSSPWLAEEAVHYQHYRVVALHTEGADAKTTSKAFKHFWIKFKQTKSRKNIPLNSRGISPPKPNRWLLS